VSAVVGREEQRAVDVCQAPGVRELGAGPDVLDEHSAGGGAIAFPKFVARDSVIGFKKERAIDVCQV
jgi:hypothetical protein